MTWTEMRDQLIIEIARVQQHKRRFPQCEPSLSFFEMNLEKLLAEVRDNVARQMN